MEVQLRTACGRGRDRGSGCSRLRYGISPLGGGHQQLYQRASRTYTGLGKRLVVGTNRMLSTKTQEKGAVTPQETDPDMPVSVQESPSGGMGGGSLLQG